MIYEKLVTVGEAVEVLGVTSILPSNKCLTKIEFDELTSELRGDNVYEPDTAPIGVYILHTDKKLYPRALWKNTENNNAVGVAVKTTNCSFVIAPGNIKYYTWGKYGTLIDGCTITTDISVAVTDYKGKENTDAIIAGLSDSWYSANGCNNYIFKNNRHGYLPALGELYEAYQNKKEIDACMSLIGGVPIYDSSVEIDTSKDMYGKWSSTQYNEIYAWTLNWDSGVVEKRQIAYANVYAIARPFISLIY